MSATEVIAVSIPVNHPSGTRRRAGFEFTTEPSIAEVTPEQKATIKADPCMTVHRRLSQAWFKAMRVDRTADNEEKYAKEDPKNWQETANCARVMEATSQNSSAIQKPSTDGNAGQDGGDDTPPAKEVINSASNKATLVKALVDLGLKAGTDFEEGATNRVLYALYLDQKAKKEGTTQS